MPPTLLFGSLSAFSAVPSTESSRLMISLRPQLLRPLAPAQDQDDPSSPDQLLQEMPDGLLTMKQRRTFLQFLEVVQVEADGEEGGLIPFELWQHLYDAAVRWSSHTKESPASEILLKARQIGISTLAEAYGLFVAMERHGNVIVLSKSLDDSVDFGRKVQVIYDALPIEWREAWTTRNTKQFAFAGGGRIQFKAPSRDAGRSTANALVIVDEAAFQLFAGLNYRAYRPTISAGGQLLVISTANGVSNWFARTWQKSKAGKMPYRVVFLKWSVRPGRDQAWYDNEKASFEGDPDDFAQEYPSTEAEAFIAKTGIVYPQFAEQLHMRDGDPVPWEDCLYRVVSTDYGGGDPTAISLWGVYRDPTTRMLKMHGYGLGYWKTGAVTVDEMYGVIAPWHERAKLTIGQCEHDATVNASLSGLLGRKGLMQPADKARGDGLGIVAMFLAQGLVTFNAKAFAAIVEEFSSYRWLHRVDPNDKDRYATGTPHDHHGDILDTLRYAAMYIYFDLMQRSARPKKSRGVVYG